MTYAAKTRVSTAQSRAEIEKLLRRYGAEGFASGWEKGSSTIIFEHKNRRIRFTLHEPPRTEFTHVRNGTHSFRRRSESEIDSAYEQAICSRWRALVLVIKAKLEAVESGITTFEEEFLAHIVTANGTVGDILIPQLDAIRDGSPLPPMLGLGARS